MSVLEEFFGTYKGDEIKRYSLKALNVNRLFNSQNAQPLYIALKTDEPMAVIGPGKSLRQYAQERFRDPITAPEKLEITLPECVKIPNRALAHIGLTSKSTTVDAGFMGLGPFFYVASRPWIEATVEEARKRIEEMRKSGELHAVFRRMWAQNRAQIHPSE